MSSGTNYVYCSKLWEDVRARISKLEVICSSLERTPDSFKEISFLSNLEFLKSNLSTIESDISRLKSEISECNDNEMHKMLNEEMQRLSSKKIQTISEIEDNLYQSEDECKKSLFLEIRAGTGGLEASLFANDLAKMYMLYAQSKNWQFSLVSKSETDVGGVREIIANISGKDVYNRLKMEAGVHRVQRVPDTETSGRVHTSTATVAILPEVEDIEIEINPSDLRIDTYRASGAGGQHVNKTDSAVRITHLPTNTVVACQDERSQHKNRAKAMKVLKSRIFTMEKEKSEKNLSNMRRNMVSSAERSDKVRTYNYPQNRVTDHQVPKTVNRLEYIMQGELDEIIDPLVQKSKMNRNINSYIFNILNFK
mgnify:CR=1 FL=1